MVYIPLTPPPAPSARARDLSEHLALLVEEYERKHPDTSPLDVRQALRLTAQRTGGNPQARVKVAIGVMLVLLAAFLVFARASKGSDAPFPILAVLVGVGVFAALIALIRVRKR